MQRTSHKELRGVRFSSVLRAPLPKARLATAQKMVLQRRGFEDGRPAEAGGLQPLTGMPGVSGGPKRDGRVALQARGVRPMRQGGTIPRG